jgi:hypothetical protein
VRRSRRRARRVRGAPRWRRELLDGGEIIEETHLRAMELKQVVLVLDWLRPLHVVVVVTTFGRRRE